MRGPGRRVAAQSVPVFAGTVKVNQPLLWAGHRGGHTKQRTGGLTRGHPVVGSGVTLFPAPNPSWAESHRSQAD
jgi:hypothetical protein